MLTLWRGHRDVISVHIVLFSQALLEEQDSDVLIQTAGSLCVVLGGDEQESTVSPCAMAMR